MELLAGLLLSLTAAVVGAWQITRRDRPIHGPIDDGTLGLPRLQRWHESYKPPRMQRLRSRFPRIDVSKTAVLLVIQAVLAGAGAIAYTRILSHDTNQEATFDRKMQLVLTRHQQAMSTDDLATAWAMLIDARAQLTELSASAPTDDARARIEDERTAITHDIQQLSGARSVSGVRAIGSFPAASENVTAQVVAIDGHIFLLSDAVYEVDPVNGVLVRLLATGDMINDQAVLTIRTLTTREDRVLAVDATRAYALDPATGHWSAEPLATLDKIGFTNIVASEAFDGNLYSLTPDTGQILKFPAGAYNSLPEDWTGGLSKDELRKGVDLAINGHVYVLLPKGTILDFFRSRLDNTLTPQVVPPISQVSAIVASEGSPYIYVLHQLDGRILVLGADGTLLQQIVADDRGPAIQDAMDLAIDSANGMAYIATSNAIFSLRLPEPPVVPQPPSDETTGQQTNHMHPAPASVHR